MLVTSIFSFPTMFSADFKTGIIFMDRFILASANAFNLDIILSLDKELTPYHTIPHFDALKIYSCRKPCEKRRNCLEQAISPFLTIFSTMYGTYFLF